MTVQNKKYMIYAIFFLVVKYSFHLDQQGQSPSNSYCSLLIFDFIRLYIEMMTNMSDFRVSTCKNMNPNDEPFI